jgi:membrane protease YdiL (CAAX protease family)
VWALAFERVRSLWPGVGAHALYNALYATGVLLAYR